MAAAVDFERLADALTEYARAYLVTVGEDGRPHTVQVEPVLRDNVFTSAGGIAPPPTSPRTTSSACCGRRGEPGGYALMVDGRVESGDGVRVVPIKAPLHRMAAHGSPAAEVAACTTAWSSRADLFSGTLRSAVSLAA